MSEWQRPEPSHRDPALDAAWKAHSTELPPPRLDAAILAAAHREVRTRPQAVGDDDGAGLARGPSRAWWGLAAAATIGAIAFGVIQLAPPIEVDPSTQIATDVPRSEAERSPSVTAPRDAAPPAELQRMPADAPATTRSSRALAPDPTPSAVPPSPTPMTVEPKQRRADTQQRERESAASPVPRVGALTEAPPAAAAPAPSETGRIAPRAFPSGAPEPSIAAAPAPAATPPAESEKQEKAAANAVDARRREAGERVAAMIPAPPAAEPARRAQADSAAQGSAAAPTAKLQVRTPAAWIERIRMLHAEQRFDEASRELNAFRDAYPDADSRLPTALQTWASGIKR